MSLHQIRRYLADLLAPDRISNNRSYPNTSHQEPGDSKHHPIFIESVNESWHTEEAAHRKKENRYWKWSLSISIVTALAAIIGGGLAYSAFIQTRRQADAAEEANRPWLIVDKIEFPLSYVDDKETTNIIIDMTVRNIGHTIAQNITMKIKSEFLDNALKEITANAGAGPKEYCLNAKPLVDSSVAFPDGTARVSNPIIFKEGKTAANRDAAGNEGTFIVAIGCVRYEDGLHRPHHTSFAYALGVVGKDGQDASGKPLKPVPFDESYGSFAD